MAKKQTDRNIHDILICIDAVNNVKRLTLTNCTKITGIGLRPLRGSLIIEQIDLSLVGDTQLTDVDQAPLSCEHVLPILACFQYTNECYECVDCMGVVWLCWV